MSHDEYLATVKATAKARIVEISQSVLSGRINVLPAAREISGLLHQIESEIESEDQLLFAGIASETDDLPIGTERQHWAEEAFAVKEVAIARYESVCRPLITAACPKASFRDSLCCLMPRMKTELSKRAY